MCAIWHMHTHTYTHIDIFIYDIIYIYLYICTYLQCGVQSTTVGVLLPYGLQGLDLGHQEWQWASLPTGTSLRPIIFFSFCWDRVSLCSPVCARTHYVHQAGLSLTDPPVVSLIKDLGCHSQPPLSSFHRGESQLGSHHSASARSRMRSGCPVLVLWLHF